MILNVLGFNGQYKFERFRLKNLGPWESQTIKDGKGIQHYDLSHVSFVLAPSWCKILSHLFRCENFDMKMPLVMLMVLRKQPLPFHNGRYEILTPYAITLFSI